MKHTMSMYTNRDQMYGAMQAEIDKLEEILSFVERWANHHAQKPRISAEEALSVIQHHPAIKKITRSYNDGVVPDTFDPYAELEELRKDRERLDWLLDVRAAHLVTGVVQCLGPYDNPRDPAQTPREAIDNAMKVGE